MSIILYGLLMAHLVAYKEQYTNIGIMFAATVIAKILVKKTGDLDNATLVNLGGSALTVQQVAVLLKKVTTSSFDGVGGTGTTKGIVPELIESIKNTLIK